MAYKPVYLLVLFSIIVIDYSAALLMERLEDRKVKKIILQISLLSNIGILAYFKYYNFIFENISTVFSFFGVKFESGLLGLILPLGLSFHTFQSMAYTIDVARNNQKAEKHLGYFANYVLFFPQMVSGPIEKYSSLGVQLKKEITYKYENFSNGFRLILYGLFVKLVVADGLSRIPDLVFNDPAMYSSFDTWIGVLAFSIQIYADFFGYSTIAIGVAICLGIRLMDNFNNPYFSWNIIEFWKRWHISLTNWFREYVYFTLGGNKVSLFRWGCNILLVFALSGLWHGASWNFIWWGVIHGVLYILESPLNKIRFKNKIIFGFLTILNFIIVSLVWVLFRSKDMKTALHVYMKLFSWENGIEYIQWSYKISIVLTLFVCMEILFNNSRIDKCLDRLPVIIRWLIYAILFISICLFSEIRTKPFIYFQF